LTLILVQSVSGPTQQRGQTLDLILSHGLFVFNLEMCNAVFSDHMPVLFEVALDCNTVKSGANQVLKILLKLLHLMIHQ